MAIDSTNRQLEQDIENTSGIRAMTPEEIANSLLEQRKDINRTNDLMSLGFAVLLVMVATIIGTLFIDYRSSVEKLHNDQYQFLQQRIDYMQKTCSPILPTSAETPSY